MKYETVNEAGVRDGTNDLPMSAAPPLGGSPSGHQHIINLLPSAMKIRFPQISRDRDVKHIE